MSVNRVTLIGHLGRDPEVRFTQGGDPVATLNLATTEKWRDKSGQQQEHTEWHRVIVWGKQGESCGKYLAKGSLVYVEGAIRSRKYTDREGAERVAYEIKAMTVRFLDRKGDGRSDERAKPAQKWEPHEDPRLDDDEIPF